VTDVGWLMGIVFAAVVLIVILVSYGVLFWVFRNQSGTDGD